MKTNGKKWREQQRWGRRCSDIAPAVYFHSPPISPPIQSLLTRPAVLTYGQQSVSKTFLSHLDVVQYLRAAVRRELGADNDHDVLVAAGVLVEPDRSAAEPRHCRHQEDQEEERGAPGSCH